MTFQSDRRSKQYGFINNQAVSETQNEERYHGAMICMPRRVLQGPSKFVDQKCYIHGQNRKKGSNNHYTPAAHPARWRLSKKLTASGNGPGQGLFTPMERWMVSEMRINCNAVEVEEYDAHAHGGNGRISVRWPFLSSFVRSFSEPIEPCVAVRVRLCLV